MRAPDRTWRGLLNDFISLKTTCKAHSAGKMTLELPNHYPLDWFECDAIFEVWRKPDCNVSGTPRPYLDSCWLNETVKCNNNCIKIEAVDPMARLLDRIVAYHGETAEALANGLPADDLIKRIVRDAIGPGAGQYNLDPDPIRDLLPIGVAADVGAAPVVPEMNFEHKKLGTVLKDIVNYAASQGVFLGFCIEHTETTGTGQTWLEFRTRIGSIKTDRTSSVILSDKTCTLQEPELTLSWKKTATRVYAGGKGEDGARPVAIADDPAVGTSPNPWFLREKWHNAGNAEDPAAIQAEADAQLAGCAPHEQLTGKIPDTEGLKYGCDYFCGDLVRAEAKGREFNVHVESVSITMRNGEESIDARVSTNLNPVGSGLAGLAQEVAELRALVEQANVVDNP